MSNAVMEQAAVAAWSVAEIEALFALPFSDLMYRAQTVHRSQFDPNVVQLSTLLSIKTGGCPEDCGYCPQSAHHPSAVEKEPMLQVAEVVAAAEAAKATGATRFCMGAAWRSPKERDLLPVMEMTISPEIAAACDTICAPGSAVANFHNSAPWMKMRIGGQ